MTRYPPSRSYAWAGMIAVVLGALSLWIARDWAPAFIAAALFALSAILLFYLALRPSVEVHQDFLVLGHRRIRWNEIRRVDQTRWTSPLVVRLLLLGGSRITLIYAGTLESCARLVRHICKAAEDALIDGVPYRQFWGNGALAPLPPPAYRVLRKEDEEEVERLYRRLKSVGHLDSGNNNNKEGE